MIKHNLGRPKLATSRSSVLTIRLYPNHKRYLKKLSKKSEMSLSDIFNEIIKALWTQNIFTKEDLRNYLNERKFDAVFDDDLIFSGFKELY